MLKPAPNYGDVVTLVPLSGIQFLDFALKADEFARHSRWFVEREITDGEESRQSLIPLAPMPGDEAGRLHDPVSGAEFTEEEAYKVDGRAALEPFLGAWLPVPFFRVIGMDARRQEVHERGPVNWVRMHMVRLAAPEPDGATHRMVLAFDTDTQDADRSEHQPYVMPTQLDAETEERFSFAPSDPDLLWFLDAEWTEEWLAQLFTAYGESRGLRRGQPAAAPRRFDALARFIVLIQGLAAVLPLPHIRLIDTHSESLNYAPIPVDLIVDVGNSRTCGILIESHGERGGGSLALSDPLTLRDLSVPQHVHVGAFESRVEFVRPMFGFDGLSRLAGRDRAFQWPSLVRIGPEAQRLSVGGSGTEGATGMSSPKRYLWDDRAAGQIWRTRRPDRPGAAATEPVSGPLLQLVTEAGDFIGGRRAKRRGRGAGQQPAIRPKFSRSALFTFLMTEILTQTITAMNSPERRSGKRYSDVPRFLRNIIMTLPPATPLAERRIMEESVEDAIDLVWRSLGWAGPRRSHHVGRPSARINLDEATATQLVYLYSEIVEKYRDEPAGFFEIMGRVRSGRGAAPTLRIASIDIGGGTSDLIVITYRLGGRKVIEPEQDFREGFRVAGDDVVDAVLANHVLPSIEAGLKAAGMAEPKTFLKGIVGADRGGMSEQERQFRRRFVVQLLEPAGLALLSQLESRAMLAETGPLDQPLGSAWIAARPEADAIAAEFDAMAARAGGRGFRLAETTVTATAEEVNATVRSVLGRALEDFAEIVARLDCDVLLVSGRPSRLPVVADMLVATLCVRPDRVVPMHRYRAGRWYPFRDAQDRIADPKTTVAVGAMLCYLAESQIEHFTVRTGHLTVKSTARFIGEMLPNDKILARDVLFSGVDLDRGERQEEEKTLKLESQTTTIGFRQLPLERWQSSPLYTIEVEVERPPSPFPVSVVMRRRDAATDPEEDPAGAELAREDFEIVDPRDSRDNERRDLKATLRLQTMKNAAGYWLDTGVISGY